MKIVLPDWNIKFNETDDSIERIYWDEEDNLQVDTYYEPGFVTRWIFDFGRGIWDKVEKVPVR